MRGVWVNPKNIEEYELLTLGAMSSWIMEFNDDKKIFIIDIELVDEENIEKLSDLVAKDYQPIGQEEFITLEEFEHIVLEVR